MSTKINYKQPLFYLVLFSLLAACSPNAAVQQELEKVKAEMAKTQAALEQANAELEDLQSSGQNLLVHVVYFRLKKDLSDQEKAAFVKEVKTLEQIEEVQNLLVGPFEDLDDARALSEYNMVMQMAFSSKEDYDNYQKHPVHLALKGNLPKYFAGSPATYDFRTK